MGLFRKKKPESEPGRQQPERKPPQATAATPPAGEPAPAAAAAPSPPTPAAGGPATVAVMDAFGRSMQMPREQWRKDVLPRLVQAHAQDPDRLAGVVLQGLRDGVAADVLPAALRLVVADPEPERSLSILAAVQRDAGDFEACAATLRELQQKRPASPAARVGLALLADREGRQAEATALLWEALQIDCNHPDALHGHLQWEQRRAGEPGVAAALDQVAALPGSWRALLWRARRAVEQQRIDDAVPDHRLVLERAGDQSDALLMIAQDLSKCGRQDLIAELVLPRYRLERHHPHVGLHLLQHFVATRQPKLGEQLLHELRMRFPRILDQQLAHFDAEFARMTAPPPAPATAGPGKVVLQRFDRPIWFGSIGEPSWLLPPKAADSRRVVFAALGAQLATATGRVQREDELGRLTRAVPLWLSEQLWLLSPLRGTVVLPVADSGGWVVSGVPWPEERLAQLLSDDERQQTLLVSGMLRPDGDKRRVDLWVYDCRQQQRIGHAAAEGQDGKLGPALLQLLAELAPIVGASPGQKPPLGAYAWWERYATGQAQLAALVVAQLGSMPKDRVYGQRAIFEWLLAVALDEPRWTPAKLSLAAALCADAAIGSHVHREMAQPFAELFRVEPAASPFARIALLPLRLLGLQHLWQHRRAEIVAAGDDAYRQWLARVEA